MGASSCCSVICVAKLGLEFQETAHYEMLPNMKISSALVMKKNIRSNKLKIS